jgi:hypothetical protein
MFQSSAYNTSIYFRVPQEKKCKHPAVLKLFNIPYRKVNEKKEQKMKRSLSVSRLYFLDLDVWTLLM